jgi:hypothetical protein
MTDLLYQPFSALAKSAFPDPPDSGDGDDDQKEEGSDTGTP